MKKNYDSPSFEKLTFGAEDVITTSNTPTDPTVPDKVIDLPPEELPP